jgi:hypothetical protein
MAFRLQTRKRTIKAIRIVTMITDPAEADPCHGRCRNVLRVVPMDRRLVPPWPPPRAPHPASPSGHPGESAAQDRLRDVDVVRVVATGAEPTWIPAAAVVIAIIIAMPGWLGIAVVSVLARWWRELDPRSTKQSGSLGDPWDACEVGRVLG